MLIFHNKTDFHLNFLVSGSWGDWGSWSTCDLTCGKGHKNKYRYCNNPVPDPSGEDCLGKGFHTDRYQRLDNKQFIKVQISRQVCKIQECPGCH